MAKIDPRERKSVGCMSGSVEGKHVEGALDGLSASSAIRERVHVEIVTELTRVKGTVNEVLFARAIAIRHLQERGVKFRGSPTNSEIAMRLQLVEWEVDRKTAGRRILEWAANMTHQ